MDVIRTNDSPTASNLRSALAHTRFKSKVVQQRKKVARTKMRSLGELSAVDVVQLSGRWLPARGRPLRPSTQLFLPPANAWGLGADPAEQSVGYDGRSATMDFWTPARYRCAIHRWRALDCWTAAGKCGDRLRRSWADVYVAGTFPYHLPSRL